MMTLPIVDLSSAIVGTSKTVDLTQVGVNAGGVSANPYNINNPPHLYFYNESGCGLIITFAQSKQSLFVAAGAWKLTPIPSGENALTCQVMYLFTNPQVSQLLIEYYAPGEPIPPQVALGNSPVGGTVSTGQATTLTNEGSAINTQIIDIGDINISGLIKFFSDHFTISVDQSGNQHFALRGQTSGRPLLIGQTGDQVEIASNAVFDTFIEVFGSGQFLPNATQVNGNVSGQAFCYETFNGTFKHVLIAFSNYKTSSNQNLALPTSYTQGAKVTASSLGTMHCALLSSGVAQNIQLWNSMSSAGASLTTQSFFLDNTFGFILSAFDTIQFQANTTATSGIIILEGL